VGDPPFPSNSSTAVHDYDDRGSSKIGAICLRAAYNRKCAAICVFEVVLVIATFSSAGIWYICQLSNRFVTSILLPFLCC